MGFVVKAQDINFLQSYYNKEFINPSLVALGNCNYLVANEQVIGVQYGGINTIRAGFSGYYPRWHSGIVFGVENELHPGNIINEFSSRLAYVYSIKILDNISLIPGLQASYEQRVFNVRNIVFPSMIGELGNLSGVNYSSVPQRSYRMLGVNGSLLLVWGNFYTGALTANLVSYNLGYDVQVRRELTFLVGYDYFSSSQKKYSGLVVVKKMDRGIESSLSFIYFLSKKISFSANVLGYNLQAGVISFTGLYRFRDIEWLFSYGTSIGPILFSMYEVGLRYEFKCKKSRQSTINCPAYEF